MMHALILFMSISLSNLGIMCMYHHFFIVAIQLHHKKDKTQKKEIELTPK